MWSRFGYAIDHRCWRHKDHNDKKFLIKYKSEYESDDKPNSNDDLLEFGPLTLSPSASSLTTPPSLARRRSCVFTPELMAVKSYGRPSPYRRPSPTAPPVLRLLRNVEPISFFLSLIGAAANAKTPVCNAEHQHCKHHYHLQQTHARPVPRRLPAPAESVCAHHPCLPLFFPL
ncbi:hypothetical protein CH63R_14599 [Colletotrichum higginsianum IMI 349063]|uniref:Uncharacterized protein n=1 Tax=Colletotrichum higginsianum (strain IMI 349063) TaxID=759273 RepID=A0A1B7XQJ1_COLHI|nr:hypothetical protein CH63R_14599 [Colletotrichum higginsianum IMI 349063]OBR02027.1 hypothetical protein CH63R_14599 [Colletotrichum higginsianum IMI 349063]